MDESAPSPGPEDFDSGRLMATAADVAGLDDFGDEGFVEALAIWMKSAMEEAYLTPAGMTGLHAEVVNYLVNRLRFEADLKEHPEILDEEVADPIVILGLPRTGTTKLQRLLSADPGAQKLAFWRLANPAPFPKSDPNGLDPRITLAREQVEQITQLVPDFMAGHPTGAEEADEEIFMMMMTFECLGTAVRVRCPSYMEWWMAQPRQGPYRYLRQLLQYLQWQDGGRRDRPWILKTPAHLGNVDVLYETFPKATLVHCHRAPAIAIASCLRLNEVHRRTGTDRIDLHENGRMMLGFFAGETARNLAQRDLLTQDQQIIDVGFGEICDNPIEVVKKIHRHRGAELSTEAEARILEWEHDNPAYKYGKFTYSLADYGLSREQVEAAFAPYLERFGTISSAPAAVDAPLPM